MESIKVFNKKLLIALLLAAAFCFHSQAAAPAHGKERLQELLLFPSMRVSVEFGVNSQGSLWRFHGGNTLPEDISQLQSELKKDPDNIKKLLQMGFLLDLDQKTNQSRVRFEQAERVCRKRLVSHPVDGLLLAQLGEALWQLDNQTEAEIILRKATQVASNSWECWAGLGHVLDDNAYRALFPQQVRTQLHLLQLPSKEALEYKPPANDIKQAEQLQQEAVQCYTRSMSLSSNEPEAFIQLGCHVMSSVWISSLLQHYRGVKPFDASSVLRHAVASPEMAEGFRKASELKPKNCKLVAAALYYTFANWAFENPSADPKVELMPEKNRRFIYQGVSQLEAISHGSDKKTAAEALLDLLVLKKLMDVPDATLATLAQRAVLLDPSNEQAWDFWLAISLDTASPDELLHICKSRLRHKNSSRNHLILAKMLAKQKQWDKAAAESRTALKLEPENIAAQMLLGAVLIQKSTDEESLSAAFPFFTKAAELLDKMPDGQEKQDRWRELTLDDVIIYALMTDEQRNKEAKQDLQNFLGRFPNDEDAKKIREAME